MDFERARHLMVEAQVRTNDVTHAGVQAAMRRLPRERFVPSELASLAYSDQELDVGGGRVLLRPRDLAKLLQAADPRPGQRALEIAGASGYGAAVLAIAGCEVVSLEPSPDVSLAARSALDQAGVTGVTTVSTPAAQGWPDAAPYDLIVLNGAAEVVPEAWIAQLAEGGRLAVIVREGAAGSARLYLKSGGVTAYRAVFDAAPPVVPGLQAPRSFTF